MADLVKEINEVQKISKSVQINPQQFDARLKQFARPYGLEQPTEIY